MCYRAPSTREVIHYYLFLNKLQTFQVPIPTVSFARLRHKSYYYDLFQVNFNIVIRCAT